MPLTVFGETYRDFSEPRFFECEDSSQVQQIYLPVDKAHALAAADNGSTDLVLWKFDAASTEPASSTVLIPDNPAYASVGRWILIPTGASGSTASSAGSGSPEGVVTKGRGALYWDYTNQVLYVKDGAGISNTGWIDILTL